MKQGEENSGYPEQDVRAAILQPDSPADRRCSLAFSADPSPESLVRAGHWKRARPLAEQMLRLGVSLSASVVKIRLPCEISGLQEPAFQAAEP